MKIDITQPPPPDIFKDRGKYTIISAVILSLALCGVGLMFYGFVSTAPASASLEKIALTLLLCPAVLFTYFGSKLHNYRKLSVREKEELASIAAKHPEISLYCRRVDAEGRQPIYAEYEACTGWAETLSLKEQRDNA